ncbi:HAD family hydrolase [Pseudohongiella nitratireducens]|uniref:HAD family hydrolase n=1 Tax=Pseudohongiella nitratireducens TaxID=1768907 RepID=UPI002409E770|nr:HAD-IA family hydrolase [Pseudohongiella nitratireducens]MDF1624081.1 HAD-IA family hydrolase [Pseudohongiella nitratireducens]
MNIAKNRPLKVAIFDWDGTVVDSVEHITDCLHFAATHIGLPALAREQYRNIIGLGLVEALRSLYPQITQDQMQSMRNAYSKHFMATSASHQRAFHGIPDLLQTLKDAGIYCAVATGKSRKGLNLALESSRLSGHFDLTRCADETRSKPDPAMLNEILTELDLPPCAAIMIGDTSYDLEMAQRIDMPAIGVKWGVHPPETLSAFSPIAIVDSASELAQTLHARIATDN